MSIGPDIKDVLQELGTDIVITKLNGSTVSGEKIDYEHYYEGSDYFRRQFCFAADFQYDSQATVGDLISFDDKTFLLLNSRKEMFENSAVDYQNFLVECNCIGRVSKRTETRNETSYDKEITYTTLHDNIYFAFFENEPDFNDEKGMEFVDNQLTMYCQNHSDIKIGNRVYPNVSDLTEYYKIISIQKYKFNDCLVCKLDEDARE